MLKPLRHTKLGAQILFIVLGLSWMLGGVAVAVCCAGFADYTYGVSFIIFGVVAIESIQKRQLWSAACLLLCAYMGPRSTTDAGFFRFWICWAILTAMSGVMWFCKCPASQSVKECIQYIGFDGYFKQLELRGALEDIQKEGSLFGFHPHGVLSMGYSINGVWSKKFNELAGGETQWLVDKVLREDNPFFKVICDLHGTISTMSKTYLRRCLGNNTNVAFVPGGFEDATAMQYGRDIVVMKKRTGFIKYALQYGYRVHPVYTFGESSSHHTFTGCLDFRFWLNKFGIPAVVVFGCPWMPLMPKINISILTYVGKAIQFPKLADPTPEDINKWHQVYCDGLTKVFEDNKKEVGLPVDAKLEIW